MRMAIVSATALGRQHAVRRFANPIQQLIRHQYRATSIESAAGLTHSAPTSTTMTSEMGTAASAVDGAHGFISFSSETKEFYEAVRNGSVILLFYKPACRPCASIRAKMINSMVGSHTPSSATKAVAAAGSEGEEEEARDGSPTAHSSPSIESDPVEVDTTGDGHGHGGDVPSSSSIRSSFTAGPAAAEQQEESTVYESVCENAKRRFAEEFREIAKNMQIIAVNTDENERLTALHDVRSLPTFMAYCNGRIVGRVEGASEDELLALMRTLVTVEDGASSATEPPTSSGER